MRYEMCDKRESGDKDKETKTKKKVKNFTFRQI
jgi:hypothetical protein